MTLTISNLSGQLKVGEPQQSGALTVYPLFETSQHYESKHTESLSYLLLTEALQSGSFEIGEVNESGDVNAVIITNMTGMPVLILDGEEILGAKQNRMVNATTLVATGNKTQVPVSCVERGRWRYSSEKFDRPGSFGYSTLRRQKSEQVFFNLQDQQSFAADQGAIWEEIDRKQASTGSHSATDALHDVYDNLDEKTNKMVADLEALPDQCGHIVFINNRFACLDLFDQPGTLQKLWPKLIKSYAVEAIEAKRERAAEILPGPSKVLMSIENSECITYPSVGLGSDLRLTGRNIVGAGLALEDKIIHLVVFEKNPEEHVEPEGHFSRPSYRRRNLG